MEDTTSLLDEVTENLRRLSLLLKNSDHDKEGSSKSLSVQILGLHNRLRQIEETKAIVDTLQPVLFDIGAETERAYHRSCEIHNSPLLALGEAVSSHILSYLNEESLLNCERISLCWKEAIASASLWQKLANDRNKREKTHTDFENFEGSCRRLGHASNWAEDFESTLSTGSIPSSPLQVLDLAESIGGNMEKIELYVRMYWRHSAKVIWEGLIWGEIFEKDSDYDHGNVKVTVGMTLFHDPDHPFLDWPELTAYQQWLYNETAHDGSDTDYLMILKAFGGLDFSVTVVQGEDLLLLATGLARVEYDEVEEYNAIILKSNTDVGAKLCILEDCVCIEIYDDV